jgi:heat shock protein HtpX
MVSALERLRRAEPSHLPDSIAAFGVQGSRLGGFKALFRTHPPLEARIARLRASG